MSAQSQTEVINLAPHPRLLSVLGDIEFTPWQCLAELVDNAFDEFLRHPSQGAPTVTISLPGRGSDPRDGEVWVKDNGPGLTMEQLQNALRAGWTSNDRHGQLGLFGMGFNIATARLGNVAVVRTARAEAPDWTVVTLDLREMAARGHFDVPVSRVPKDSPREHGTEIIIKELKPQHHETLSRQQNKIRLTLGDIYSYLLSHRDFQLIVDRQAVKPRRPCIWGENRSVVRSGERIPAVIHIDERLADRNVCLECGHWQDDPAECDLCHGTRLEVRERRIWGWLGIQRYLHPTDFGIDFLRNGRKILLRDVRLFSWVDPDDPTGRGEQEYPIELPSGQGRIVGEIHVDHIQVNYQKNAFEYDSPAWRRVVKLLRGEAPLRPKAARALELPVNTSPLARLFAGYRRNDPGLNYLIPGDGRTATHDLAKQWADRFRREDPEFQTDEQWYIAAERHSAPPSAPAPEPAPEADADAVLALAGLLDPPPASGATPAPEPQRAESEDDRRARWRAHGQRLPDLESAFGLPGFGAPLQITAVWLVGGHKERIGPPGESRPVYVGTGRGSTAEVFVDAEHRIFTEFAVDSRDLVVLEIADHLRQRDRSSRSIGSIFYELKERCLPDHKVAGPFLKQAADRILSRLREQMLAIVAGSSSGYWDLLTPDDQAATQRKFAAEGGRADWDTVVSTGQWLDYAPAMSLVRLVSSRPDAFLDGRALRSRYSGLSDQDARRASVERVVDLLGDVAVLSDHVVRRGPEELLRGRLSCQLLEAELADDDRGVS
jgi:Histidine kinase-, DNA gyrase B-, and HSP90-like ATPase